MISTDHTCSLPWGLSAHHGKQEPVLSFHFAWHRPFYMCSLLVTSGCHLSKKIKRLKHGTDLWSLIALQGIHKCGEGEPFNWVHWGKLHSVRKTLVQKTICTPVKVAIYNPRPLQHLLICSAKFERVYDERGLALVQISLSPLIALTGTSIISVHIPPNDIHNTEGIDNSQLFQSSCQVL